MMSARRRFGTTKMLVGWGDYRRPHHAHFYTSRIEHVEWNAVFQIVGNIAFQNNVRTERVIVNQRLKFMPRR